MKCMLIVKVMSIILWRGWNLWWGKCEVYGGERVWEDDVWERGKGKGVIYEDGGFRLKVGEVSN